MGGVFDSSSFGKVPPPRVKNNFLAQGGFFMGKIATEEEAQSLGNGSGAESNRMCTKARAIALGCIVNGSYSDNQLVQYEHLDGKMYATPSSLSGGVFENVVTFKVSNVKSKPIITTESKTSTEENEEGHAWVRDIVYANFNTYDITFLCYYGSISVTRPQIGTKFQCFDTFTITNSYNSDVLKVNVTYSYFVRN